MQVNVLIAEQNRDGAKTQILVLPFGPDMTIPEHLHHIEWRYFATTEADNRIIGAEPGEVELAIERFGFMVVDMYQ